MCIDEKSYKLAEYFLTIPNNQIIDYNLRNNHGQTAFMWSSGNPVTSELIVKHASSRNIDLFAKYNDGKSAQEYVAEEHVFHFGEMK